MEKIMDFGWYVYGKIMYILSFLWENVTNDFMKTIETILTAYGCYLAYKALDTWRHQVIEQPKIEFAREALEHFYRIVDLITKTRRNFIMYNKEEIKAYYDNDKLTQRQCACLARYKILDENKEHILNFQSLKYKTKVMYEGLISDELNKMDGIITQIMDAYENYISDIGKPENKRIYNIEQLHQMEQLMYWQNEKDKINLFMNELKESVEKKLKPFYKI